MQQDLSRSSSIWLWLAAKQLSDISTSLNTIVISVYAFSLFDDPAILGLILALKMAGAVVGAFLVPAWSHRLTYRTILITSDFANAGLLLMLALSPGAWHPSLILLLPAIMGVFQGTFHVSLYSQSHHFLGVEQRLRMNSIFASMDGVAVVAGGILASVVYGRVPVTSIFLIDSITFIIAGFAFMGFRGGLLEKNKTVLEVGTSPLNGLSVTMLRSLLATTVLLFGARFVEAFGSATHNVGFPIISTAYAPENHAFLIGWILASWGVGKVAAAPVIPRVARFLDQRRIGEDRIFMVLLILTFAFFLGIFTIDALWLILAFAFLAGLFDASTEAVYYAILQRSQVAQTDYLISLSYLVERAGMGLGIIAVGYAFSSASAEYVACLFYLGAIALCMALLASTIFTRKRPCKNR